LFATAESNPTMAELKMKTHAKRMVSEDNMKSERNSAKQSSTKTFVRVPKKEIVDNNQWAHL
jgi:hypothetical protein